MNDSSEPNRNDLEDAREIQHWVRRYAQNRSLPKIVALALYALLFAGIALPSYWGGVAHRSGNIFLFAVCVVLLVVASTGIVFMSVPRWNSRVLQQIAQRLYANEGQVTISAARSKPRWWGIALATTFGMCVIGQVIFGPTGKYEQPISAIYAVPFLVALNLLQRPIAGYIPLLWPLLYAIHAVLILSGAPIVFTGRWESLNMLIPVVGYGMLTALVGHLYSRWALHNVRTIVSHQLDRAELVDGDQP